MTPDPRLPLLLSASAALHEACETSTALGDTATAKRARAIGIQIGTLIGEIATAAPREERTVS